jgi:iron complex outermembrane receptor protein
MLRHTLVAVVGAAALGFGSTAFAQGEHEVVAPVVAHHVDAVYPPSALAERKHADVVLTVTIDVDGHVSKVDVIESGGPDLDEAATVAAREWTFVPAMRDGKPVASRIKMPFHFAPPALPPELVETPVAPGEVPVHDAVPSGPVPPPAPAPAASAAPEEVHVTGSARSPSRGPSDFELPVGELAVVPRATAGDFLKLAPGVLVTNEGGEGHAESIVLRGFDAGEGEAMELSVGGVPINDPGNFHGNGYADTHFMVPEIIESVRVLEGPFDPHQGNFAVAGSANYELGLAQRGVTAKWTGGSFGSERMFLAWGPEDENRHTFGAAEYTRSNGYGQNRAYERGSAVGQYEGKLGDRGTWRLTGQAYSVVAQAAGVIREDDYDAGRIGFYDAYDPHQGQDSSRFSLAADLETRSGRTVLAQQLFVIARSLRIREDFTGFVTDAGTFDSRGTMLDLAMTEQSIGARGSARTHADALGQRQEFEIGYYARGDSVNNVQHLVTRDTQAPYATDADIGGALGDVALYADASLKPLSWITVRGGVRGELFTYDVEDRCLTDVIPCTEDPLPTGNPRTSAATSALLPRASVLLGSFEGVTFSGSFGQGVRSLAIDEIATDASSGLATISSYEGGASYAHATAAGELTLRSVFYGTRINRDEIFDPVAGRTVETGATTRDGWVGAGRLTGGFYDISANVALVHGIVDATHEGIPYVPHVSARSDMAIFGNLPWTIDGHPVRASVGPAITFVGVRSLPYGQSSDPYALVDAAAKLTWRAFELGLVASNVFDVKYRLSEFTFASDFHTQPNPSLAPERSFTAGAPRMLFLSLGATLGG